MTVNELIELLEKISNDGYGEAKIIISSPDCISCNFPTSVEQIDADGKLVCIDSEAGGFFNDPEDGEGTV